MIAHGIYWPSIQEASTILAARILVAQLENIAAELHEAAVDVRRLAA